MINSKKAIHAIIATSLLIVVTVVALGAFQIWFNSFQSSTFTSVEQKGNSQILGTNIDSIIGTSLFFQNGFDSVSVSEVKINGISCPTIPQEYTTSSININIDNCTLQVPENELDVTVITDKGIYSKTILKENTFTSQILNCSAIGPGEWIRVPSNSKLGTKDFCVMRYEAKATTSSETNLHNSVNMYCGDPGDGGGGTRCPTDGSVNITSKAESLPLRNVYQTEARELCSNLGEGFSLTTNNQWITIARNIEQISSNWANGVIGSTIPQGGGLKKGNLGESHAGAYNSGNPVDRSLDTNNKSLLILSNGERIWDFSGNVREWINDTFNNTYDSSLGTNLHGWQEWNEINSSYNFGPLNPNYNSSQGIGKVLVNNITNGPNTYAFRRGGSYEASETGGIYNLNLNILPEFSRYSLGFRCTYTPY